MLLKTKHIVCILGFLLIGFISQAQENEKGIAMYLQWQTSNCGINEDANLLEMLLKNAEILEPLLIQGFRQGPSAEYIEGIVATELERFRINQKLIAEEGLETGLSKEDLQIAAEINMDTLQNNLEKDITKGWKTRALSGLSYLDSKMAKNLIKRVANDKNNEFNSFAKYLISQRKN